MLRRLVLLSAAPTFAAALIAAASLAPVPRPALLEETWTLQGVRAHLYAPAAPFAVVLAAPGWGERAHRQERVYRALAALGYLVLAVDDAPMREPLAMGDDAGVGRMLAEAEWRVDAGARRLSAALDWLAQDHRFAPLLGEKRVGVLGYSIGGAIGAEAAVRDPRITAVINLDGWLFGAAARGGPSCAYLWTLSRESLPRPQRDAIERKRREDLNAHMRFATRDTVRWLLAPKASHHALGGPTAALARADAYAAFFGAAWSGEAQAWARFSAAARDAGFSPISAADLGAPALDMPEPMSHP